MSTFIRSAILAVTLIGTVSAAASASPNPAADAKTYFAQMQQYGN